MELKKSDKADLEKRRGLFFQVGLVVALGVILLAFEWQKKPEVEDTSALAAQVAVEEEIAQVTRPPEVKPPPPPPQITEVLNLVDDNIKIENDIDLNVESDDNLALSNISYVDTKPSDEETVDETPFVMVEDMPQFQGGSSDSFREYIAKNMKYPEIAAENGISGRVYIQFCVNSKGDVVDVIVLRGVDSALDKEAVRVVSGSPKWTPGKQRGKAVKVQFTFPVNFVLQ
jgi:periplasmic protein TonB